MIVENRSASSRMHMVVEDAPPPTPTALPYVAMPSTRPSVPLEAPEVPHLHPILPLPPSHISHMTLLVLSCSPFAMPDGRWELGSDIQVALVKLVGMMVTSCRTLQPMPSSRHGCRRWRTGWRATWEPPGSAQPPLSLDGGVAHHDAGAVCHPGNDGHAGDADGRRLS